MIEIDEIELLPFSSITDEDLARAGEPDLETLRRRAAHAGPIDDDTLLYRVEFHVVRQQDKHAHVTPKAGVARTAKRAILPSITRALAVAGNRALVLQRLAANNLCK
jgi:hypothetical protein